MTTCCKRAAFFLFPKRSDEWVALLRVGLGVEVVLYCLSEWSGWIDALSSNSSALSARRVSEALLSLESTLIPRVDWLLKPAGHLGLRESTLLWMVWSVLLLSGLLLTLGFFCRPAAVTAWLLHLACVKSGDMFAYGMDNFVSIGLFYLMLSPLPDSYSIESRIWKIRLRNARMVGFFRRALQLHLCIIYFFSGLAKSLGTDWWNGLNIWAAVTRPPFNVFDPILIAHWRFLLPAVGITICLIEIGYPIFIWPRRTRPIWLTCVLAMHGAIGIAMGMYLFGLIMIILNLAAFAPHWIFRQRTPSYRIAKPEINPSLTAFGSTNPPVFYQNDQVKR